MLSVCKLKKQTARRNQFPNRWNWKEQHICKGNNVRKQISPCNPRVLTLLPLTLSGALLCFWPVWGIQFPATPQIRRYSDVSTRVESPGYTNQVSNTSIMQMSWMIERGWFCVVCCLRHIVPFDVCWPWHIVLHCWSYRGEWIPLMPPEMKKTHRRQRQMNQKLHYSFRNWICHSRESEQMRLMRGYAEKWATSQSRVAEEAVRRWSCPHITTHTRVNECLNNAAHSCSNWVRVSVCEWGLLCCVWWNSIGNFFLVFTGTKISSHTNRQHTEMHEQTTHTHHILKSPCNSLVL